MRRQAKYRLRRARRLRIACAAVRVGGHVHALPRPARHHTILHALWANGYRGSGDDQGFTLNDGRYVDRTRAHVIAKRAGQLIPRRAGAWAGEVRDQDGRDLFSEDLW